MLVRVTGRWTVIGGDALNDRLERGEALIGCFWHGRLMMMPYLWRRGRRIAGAGHHLGHRRPQL